MKKYQTQEEIQMGEVVVVYLEDEDEHGRFCAEILHYRLLGEDAELTAEQVEAAGFLVPTKRQVQEEVDQEELEVL